MADKQPVAWVECEFGQVRISSLNGRVAMGCRPDCIAMTLDEARALAMYLNEVADGIEGKPVAPTYFERCVAAAREFVAAIDERRDTPQASWERWIRAQDQFSVLTGGPDMTKARMLLHIADKDAPTDAQTETDPGQG